MRTEVVAKEEAAAGLVEERSFVRKGPEEDVTVVGSNGRRLKVYRYVDVQQAIIEMDAEKKQKKLFRA